MKQLLLLLYYDFKEMGIGFLVPIVTLITITVYGICIYNGAVSGEESKATVIVLNLLQDFLPPINAWWVIVAFHRYAEEEDTEAFFSYSFSCKKTGIGRTIVFMGIFSVLLFISLIFIYIFRILDFESLFVVYIALVIQAVFYGSCGFVFIISIRNTIWSISAILIIAALNIWGNIPIISQYLSVVINMQPHMNIKQVYLRLLFLIIVSVILLYKAQNMFKKLSQKKYG